MEYEKPFPEDSFSSRSGHTSTTHSYNGVFTRGKSRKLSSSMNEAFYQEIFRLPGCSIPILDIPELNQMGNDWDILRQADYSNIFHSTVDCAIPLEDLLPQGPNAQETLRRKGKSSYMSRDVFVAQREQTLSSEPLTQSFSAGIKLNIPSCGLVDQRSFDESCLNMGVNQVKDVNKPNRFSDGSSASSSKEVGVEVAADLGDVIAMGNGNESFSNDIVSETDSIYPNFRLAENSQNHSGSHDSFVSPKEYESKSYSQILGNENSHAHDTHENASSTNHFEEIRFVSKFPTANMESCELDMKGCGALSDRINASQELRYSSNEASYESRCSANEASQTDIILENKSGQLFSKRERTDTLRSNSASEHQVVEHSLSYSKSTVLFSDEKLFDSACEDNHNPAPLQGISISNISGDTFPLDDPSLDNFQNFTERDCNSTESNPSEDFLDAVVEENYASAEVPSREMLEAMNDANVVNRSSDMTYENLQFEESENSSEYNSPAFSDEEKDDNSVAAASAAAVRKAIEEAQATIKVAKELMVKTKDGRQTTPKRIPFSAEESQCKVSNLFSRSLNFAEDARNEHKTASIMTTHSKNICFTEMSSSGNSHPQTVSNSETTEVDHELKTNLEEEAFIEIQMRRDDDKPSSANSDFLVNFGTFQWNFNASNFKSLQERESVVEDEDAFDEPRVSPLESTIDEDQVVHEHEQRDYPMESRAQNEDCTLNRSECLNGNCDTPVPSECCIKEPSSESNEEFNEQTGEYCNLEQAEPLLQNRELDIEDDIIIEKECEEKRECSSIESSCNEICQDSSNIEISVNGREDSNKANCNGEHVAIKKEDEATSSKLAPESQEEESSVVHNDENIVLVETDESDWYEETIEGVTITAELMKANEVANPIDCVTGKNINDIEPVMISDESDEDPETSDAFYETKVDSNISSGERSLHDEDHIRSHEAWFPEEVSKHEVECDETPLSEECSEEDRKSSNHETVFPSVTAEEYDDTSTWLPADEDDYTSISSDEHVGDDNSVPDEDFIASVAENDTNSRCSDEQWDESETQPEQSPKISNLDTSEHQMVEDEKVLKAQEQEEENERKKKKELEARRQRIVVERAIKEARERAFAEAAQQFAAKNVAKSQENEDDKVERTKTKVDDASMNAKLQSERAAVEKATTAARVRAFEKLLAEMASGKASSQKNPSNPDPSQHKDHTQSTHNQDLNEGVQSNSSSYWEKLAMEKHQQTAKRAAKALAEKNKREQLAKEEQDERHRIGETLDADVKRWARGKERNLRALLSTLQFILGPESGWQPISRNDLVSASAVKKAYIKATLFVHPDKMQQRGATISQKYTCEKVFDLLKEARDKFSKEDK